MPLPLVPLVLGALGLAGGGALVVAARSSPAPGWPPLPSQPKPRNVMRYSAALAALAGKVGKVEPFQFVPLPAATKPVPAYPYEDPPRTTKQAALRFSALRLARPDADPHHADGFSRWTYLVHSWGGDQPWVYSGMGWRQGFDPKGHGIPVDPTGGAGVPLDEFGRSWTGVSGGPFGTLLKLAGFAVPFIPGVGPAASAALAAAVALGQGKSLKDAALAGARAAMPGGELGKLAFDAGVGVASGQGLDAAAERAFAGYLAQEQPEALAAYQAGKKLGAL